MIKYTVYVHENGDRSWFINDQYHREDGPACEWANGDRYWCQNGQLHRADGPAIERVNGRKYWYLHGREYPEQEFLELTQPIKNMTVAELERALGYKIRVVKG